MKSSKSPLLSLYHIPAVKNLNESLPETQKKKVAAWKKNPAAKNQATWTLSWLCGACTVPHLLRATGESAWILFLGRRLDSSAVNMRHWRVEDETRRDAARISKTSAGEFLFYISIPGAPFKLECVLKVGEGIEVARLGRWYGTIALQPRERKGNRWNLKTGSDGAFKYFLLTWTLKIAIYTCENG